MNSGTDCQQSPMQKSVKDLKLNTIIADKLLLKLDLKQSPL